MSFACSSDEPKVAVDDVLEIERIAEGFMSLAGAAALRLTSDGLVSSAPLADELLRAGGRLSQTHEGARMAFLVQRIAISLSAAELKIVRR